MASRAEMPLTRTIRRSQLREIVPLADSTIYEMEQRGEFPRRFALSPRCVVWDLAEVEAWLASRRSTPIPRAQHPDVQRRRTRPSKGRVDLKDRHRRRDEHRHVFAAFNPSVEDIRPFLHHMAALHLVLGLVVNAAR